MMNDYHQCEIRTKEKEPLAQRYEWRERVHNIVGWELPGLQVQVQNFINLLRDGDGVLK